MSGPSVKAPADWLDSSKTERLGSDAVMLMFTALGHSARQTSNGVVERDQLRKLWPVADLDDCVARLVKGEEAEERGDELYFVNWRKFILEADEVDRIRTLGQIRDERRRRHSRGDHSMCQPRYCSQAPRENQRESTRENHATPRVSHGAPTRTDPDRPLGRGGEGGRAAGGSAGAPPPAVAGERHLFAPADDDGTECVCGGARGDLIHRWVHEYPMEELTDAQLDMTPLPPCPVCGLPEAAYAHCAHDFEPEQGTDHPEWCEVCSELERNPVHRWHTEAGQ